MIPPAGPKAAEQKLQRLRSIDHIDQVVGAVLWSHGTKLEHLEAMDQRYVWRRKNDVGSKKNTLPTCSGLLEGNMDSSKDQEHLEENISPSERNIKSGRSKRKMIPSRPGSPPRGSPGSF